MWQLFRAGYQPVIMVHDEIVCEIPEGSDHEEARRDIERIMIESMEEFTRGIPVKCESVVSMRWEK